MKKIYIAILLLCICAGVCIFEQTAINNVYSNTNNIIDCALNYSKRKDFANSKKECIKLNEYWNKKYIFLSAMIDHSQLDSANASIISTKEIEKDNFDELSEKLIEAKSEIEIIKENQSITAGNIF